jgi:ATP-dependent RNA helicase UAP56/SUB2
MEAIPTALQGCDLLCQSKSGTGKTMVFVVTILNSLVTDRETGEYLTGQAIIIANTRELAHQIFKDFLRMGRYFRQPELRVSCFFGGISLEENSL